jgi:hypothetical protein
MMNDGGGSVSGMSGTEVAQSERDESDDESVDEEGPGYGCSSPSSMDSDWSEDELIDGQPGVPRGDLLSLFNGGHMLN